jgi:hypothetical protein
MSVILQNHLPAFVSFSAKLWDQAMAEVLIGGCDEEGWRGRCAWSDQLPPALLPKRVARGWGDEKAISILFFMQKSTFVVYTEFLYWSQLPRYFSSLILFGTHLLYAWNDHAWNDHLRMPPNL